LKIRERYSLERTE